MPIDITVLSSGAVATMVAWLAVSAVGQIPCELTRRLRRVDLCGLIPHWTFFAPVPGTADYFLLYRDQLLDGSLTDWRELPLCDSRKLWHLIWNPGKREKKALFDLTTALMQETQAVPIEAMQLSVPYLVLLSYISGLPRDYTGQGTQFLLMMSDQGGEPKPIFSSAVHAL
jgi:hypothetical protein